MSIEPGTDLAVRTTVREMVAAFVAAERGVRAAFAQIVAAEKAVNTAFSDGSNYPRNGMRTYVPDQWLRYWFLGGPPEATYRHPDQLSHRSPAEFAEQLAAVWTNMARACIPRSRWVIRFGGIHDRKARPKDILLASLRGARCKLRVLTVRSAGLSSRGKRQADQFQRPLGNPIEEWDFHVRVDHQGHLTDGRLPAGSA